MMAVLVTASIDVELYSGDSFELLGKLETPQFYDDGCTSPASVCCCGFSRDFSLVAISYCHDGCSYFLRVWDVATSKLKQHIWRKYVEIFSVCFNISGTHLFLKGPFNKITVLDWSSNTVIFNFNLDFEDLRKSTPAILTNDGLHLLTAAKEKLISWSAVDGHQEHMLCGHAAPIACVVVSEFGDLIATGAENGVLVVWDVLSWTQTAMYEGGTTAISHAAFSWDGSQLALNSTATCISIIDSRSGACIRIVELDLSVGSIMFHPLSSNMIVCLTYARKIYEPTVQVIDVAAAEEVVVIKEFKCRKLIHFFSGSTVVLM